MSDPKGDRVVAITKKISLAEFSDGWDDCYVLVRPATKAEVMGFAKLDVKAMTEEQQLAEQMKIIRDHFVSGKIKVLNAVGEAELVDMVPDDVEASMPMANKVFFDILGVVLDPKDSLKAA
jgi:hypothetical protein